MYYNHSVGNGITFSGIDWRLVAVSGDPNSSSVVSATAFSVSSGSYDILMPNGRVLFRDIGLTSLWYIREFLGYNVALPWPAGIIWGPWQLCSESITTLKCTGSNSTPFLGTASPPPPPPRNMCGCDCNTIASIIAEQMAEKQRLLDAIKEHIDTRTLEQLSHINKMLQGIDMDLDLQPIIDEIKRAEANLWNGISGGG